MSSILLHSARTTGIKPCCTQAAAGGPQARASAPRPTAGLPATPCCPKQCYNRRAERERGRGGATCCTTKRGLCHSWGLLGLPRRHAPRSSGNRASSWALASSSGHHEVVLLDLGVNLLRQAAREGGVGLLRQIRSGRASPEGAPAVDAPLTVLQAVMRQTGSQVQPARRSSGRTGLFEQAQAAPLPAWGPPPARHQWWWWQSAPSPSAGWPALAAGAAQGPGAERLQPQLVTSQGPHGKRRGCTKQLPAIHAGSSCAAAGTGRCPAARLRPVF